MKQKLCGFIFGMTLCISAQASNTDINQVPLNDPWGIAVNGNVLYVADTINDVVRVVDIPTGKMSMLHSSGPAFYRPDGIVVSDQIIFVGDFGRISKIELPKNIRSAFVGTGRAGSADGIGITATLTSPSDLVVDGN